MADHSQTIVFIGDSITDASRDRSVLGSNARLGLGSGYVFLIAAKLLAGASSSWRIYNRGVGSDSIDLMSVRWDRDCLSLNPDILSILIGINDFALGFRAGDVSRATSHFDTQYRKLLDRTMQQHGQTKLVLMEPFHVVVDEREQGWVEGMRKLRSTVRQIATDYGAHWIDLQAMFNQLVERDGAGAWLPDGVHPSAGGHYHVAHQWIELTGCAQEP